ncbi:MAG: hypothetical protein IJX15_08735, partial [Ruminiclostridium sp.]|nr:hypothetical protein [Ruminiclostridium sp.]
MQVFKTYMKIVKKNIFMAIVYTAIFIVLAFMFSNNTYTPVDFEDAKRGVTIIDEDNSTASKALYDYIASKHVIVELNNNKDEILDALYYTRTDYVLTIKKGYEEKISAGKTEDLFTNYQVPDTYDGVLLDNSINNYVKVMSAYIVSGNSIEEAANNTVE